MLLLVTLALVAAAAVALALGFVRDALGYIYLSMVCAGVAAVALFVFTRLAGRPATRPRRWVARSRGVGTPAPDQASGSGDQGAPAATPRSGRRSAPPRQS